MRPGNRLLSLRFCYTAVRASDFRAMTALRDQLGKRFVAGVALYLGDQVVPFGDKLTLVPLSVLWAK